MNNHRQIYIIEPSDYSQAALEIYAKAGCVCLSKADITPAKVVMLVVRLGKFISAEVMAGFPNLKIIASPTTGLNHIDLNYCLAQNIKVVSLKGETNFLRTVTATAEHTFALLLMLIRNILGAHLDVTRCKRWQRDLFCGRDLSAMTLGIVGMGRLGRKVAEYAKFFGMRVVATDLLAEDFSDLAEPVSLDCLLQESDVVSLHVNYTKENYHFWDNDKFNKMKAGSYFINTARGELVVEKDLLAALSSGRLAAAALDVLDDEYLLDLVKRPLLEYACEKNNLILTPHIGGCTFDSMRKTEDFIAKKACAALGAV